MTHPRATVPTAALLLALGGAGGPRPLRGQGAAPAGAQPSAGAVRVGERVRFHIPGSTAADGRRRCEGRVIYVALDTVAVAGAPACPAGSFAAAVPLRVARGDRGSRLGHALLGVLGGAALGALAGRVHVGEGCRLPGCTPADGRFAVAATTAGWGAAGAVAGGLVGLVLPAGPRWVTADGALLLRVTTAGDTEPGRAPRPAARSHSGTGASVTVVR